MALVAGALAVGLPAWRGMRRAEGSRAAVRFTIDVEQSGVTAAGLAGGDGGLLAFSPDGRFIAYRGARQGVGQLFLHSMDRLTSTALAGTEGGYGPFFSPDGRWLGFFAEGRLKKISLDTLAVEVLCEAPDGRGGTWTADGTIFFAPRRTSLIWRVSAEGGTPEPVSHLDEGAGEMSHRWPLLLPARKVLLYQSMDTSERSRIVSQSLSTGERKTLIERGEGPRLAPSGHLLFTIQDSLWAVPFDARNVRVEGSPIEMLEKPLGHAKGAVAAGRLDVSVNGALATLHHLRQGSDSILWRVERSGHASPISDLRRAFHWPRFSPDGQRLAVSIGDDTGSSIWVYDVPRRSLTRVTFDGHQNEGAIWAPDGRRLLYRSNRTGPFNLFVQPADGSGNAEPLVTSETDLFAGSWSPDGRALIFQEESYAHGPDIWVQPLTGRRTRRPIANSAFGEWDGVFSPDGRLVAFTSMESGRLEVYVQPYPGLGGKRQVSNEGGNSPVWSRSGRELFYLNGDKMMAASISHRGGITLGKPEVLFEGDYAFAGHLANYDVTPDDRAFVMIRGEGKKPWMQLNVVLNWSEELKRRVPRQR